MRWFIVCLLSVILALWIATPAISVVWSAGAFDSTPALGDPVSEGDDRIRELKEEIRYRAEVEHWWANDPDGEDNDNGLHRLGSGRCYVGTTAPTELSDSHSGIGAGNLADYDNTTDTTMSGENTLAGAATNSAAGIEDDVGHGRCWLDTDGPDDDILTLPDNNKMWVYVGGTGWVDTVWASVRPEGDDEILAGAYNLVYNGSFEATEGTGLAASVVEPEGWLDADADVTVTYTDPTTDVDFGEGYEIEITDGGAGNGELTQLLPLLAANKVYKVIARAMDDGVSTCTLDVTGPATPAFAPDTTTTNAWETLTGTFGTGAVFENATIELITTGVAGVCLWDHVNVYAIDDVATDRDEISQPGVYKVRAERAAGAGDIIPCNNTIGGAGTCAAAATGLRVNVTPSSPGTVIMVYAQVEVFPHGFGNDCFLRLFDGTGELDRSFLESGAAGGPRTTLGIQHTIVNPVPGTTLVIDADVWAVVTANCDVNDDVTSYIEAVVIPTR